ncbi:MAG TPA: DUF502 domain-containing protein [Patescibacteria group bacterium]|jgi:uncharacterized membrane protein|nr:DUF502 domain-containing protein [Patescibacteria group bacterium]
MKSNTLLTRLNTLLWNIFFGGLMAILPITLTVAIFNTSIKMIVSWLEPFRRVIPATFLQKVPYAEVVCAIAFVLIIGSLYNYFILDRVIHSIERLVKQIPLVRPVYSGIKQLVKVFGSQEKLSFQRVVLVHFPRHGIYSIGFITSQLSPAIAPDAAIPFYTVFIPTTPNPTSGFCIVAPEHELIATNLNSQEAMTMIISGGIIQPHD